MKRIKKYVKPKEEKPAEPQALMVRLPSRFRLGIQSLFEVSPNLKEIEANLSAGDDGCLYFFQEADLKLLYTLFRNGEIDLRYLKKWFKLFIMVYPKIGLWQKDLYSKTMLELLTLAHNNRLTRKNFIELNKTLFLRIDKEQPLIWIG